MNITHMYYHSVVPSGVYWLLYLYAGTVNYILYRKARVDLAWFAYIPFLSLFPLLWTIRKSAWNVLWVFVPIANVIFLLIWAARFFHVFGMSRWVLILFFIPWIGPLLLLVILSIMAFSPAYFYDPRRITWPTVM
ncbi:hypothetical protein [Sulfoacidibacillus thermotolerans]|uniref:Uncharacterized protein n=1 Tax=Sulfoacidibacillus thermotolerans TaxID=1765684 RepID=A0A2U3D7Y7_SULT2|nr:hypothetical protein [Sulfoacidibacillus thermotolerans]PWI57390.1 hypothetical protein BM613_08670 [Sulfoacidibacillus thermotolerans]